MQFIIPKTDERSDGSIRGTALNRNYCGYLVGFYFFLVCLKLEEGGQDYHPLAVCM